MKAYMSTEITTAIIAAIVSGVVSLIISYRGNTLHYITDERKSWRNEIREIGEKLSGASYCETRKLLDCLKLRLNAYGGFGRNTEVLCDKHIWDLIREMEKPVTTEFSGQKHLLIEFLALLLKYDWERAKDEVKINKNIIASSILYVASYAVLLAGLVIYFLKIKTPIYETIAGVGVIGVMFLILYVVLKNTLHGQKNMEGMLNTSKGATKTYIFMLGKFLVILIALSIFAWLIQSRCGVDGYSLAFSLGLFMLAAFLTISERFIAVKKQSDYLISINMLIEQYEAERQGESE